MSTYEISWRGDELVSHAHGSTASQAKYNLYLRMDGCFESFRDFLRCVKGARKVAPQRDAYDFIERQYGRRFYVGELYTVVGEGSATGREVEVVHPSGYGGAYVSVLLDGDMCLFHPMSLEPHPHNGEKT